ncbi:uncharacterized protein LOC109425706 [Aedes albopictus]|uniref:Uncharacterized protein n=1 Tax=Aedes albopictus TaxID=7160 RepID=A0ABM1Y1A7_AEDAL|nr:uncharacterized protein LOC109425706 [Aedes albopictus]
MSIPFAQYLCQNGFSTTVSIEQRIQESKSQGKSPTIVIDLMYYDQLEGYLNRPETNVKMGDLCGISRLRVQKLERFVANMKDWGAELIFVTNGAFFDTSGQIIPDQDDSKGNSKDWRYDLQCAITDYLGNEHYSRVAQDARFIPIERIWTESVVKVARKYGRILWAWDNTRHQEIVKVASVNDALAIISKHFAVLMYSGLAFPRYKLWSLVDCSVQSMTTNEFDPLTIRRSLRLSAKQMRLLAALSDRYFGTATFVNFAERMRFSSQRSVANLIAYVRKTAGNLQELDYLKIARDLFGEEKYIEKFDEFKAVCESYDISKITLSTEQNNDCVSMQLKKQDSFNYDIYHGIKFTVSITFIDYRYWEENGVDFYEVCMALYRRISGVILQHKKDPTLVRYVNIKRSHQEAYGTVELEPEYPEDFYVPSLEAIYSMAERPGVVTDVPDFNVRLLEFITGMPLDRSALEFFWKTDQRSQLQDSLTLCYMLKLNMMDTFEADMFLLGIHRCRREEPRLIPLPKNLNLRAFHLYFVYIKMRTLMKHSFYAAGLDDTFMDECYLDGLLFQNLFQQWRSAGDTESFREEMTPLKRFRLH